MADKIKTVPLDNDHVFSYEGRTLSTTTGLPTPATGITGLEGWFAVDEETADTPLTGTDTALAARSPATHSYYGTLARTALNTALDAYVGKVVVEVLARDGYVETCEPVKVVRTRRPRS